MARKATSGLQNSAAPDRVDYGFLPELVGYQLRRAQVAAFADFARATRAFSRLLSRRP